MVSFKPLVVSSIVMGSVDAFQQQQQTTLRRRSLSRIAQVERVKHRAPPALSAQANPKPCCDPCQQEDEDEDDLLLDRREAAFAMLGTLWATTGVALPLFFPQDYAHATYGEDAKIALPNPIEAMSDRATKQCLVESLGNRECLVYAGDEEKLLYKGADTRALLERIDKASAALATIPQLAGDKKWSQVTGILTGPMGELIRNMGQLADLSENAAAAKAHIKQVKLDLYAISAAVDQKNQAKVIQAHEAATNSLVAFVKSL